jgi:hypothetical protein
MAFFVVTALSFFMPDLGVFFAVFGSTKKLEPISR